jgi:BirA family transcriptional regulator, biotin operon repressor / biotin---[acetyl-CoA-carboxylase] ligase
VAESPYTDLDRPPLNERALTDALVRPGGLWRRIQVVAETGSTNADLAEMARHGAEEGVVLVAEAQTAGRGRLDRRWTAPPRSGLTFSVLLRPDVGLGWLPLLAGVAVVGALRGFAEVEGVPRGRMGDAALKWPNDVLIGERKLGGILAERVGGAVVIGIGLNVSLRADELPTPNATSLALEGAPADRDPVLRAILRELATRYATLGDTEALRKAYVSMCATVGRQVRVELPDGSALTGLATDIDESGRLVVGDRPLSAGDITHVR